MPRRKRIPIKPEPETTVIIEHEDEVLSDVDYEDESLNTNEPSLEEDSSCSLSYGASQDVIELLKRSRSKNPTERKAALRSMCPCRVKREIDPFWVRIVEMCSDPDPSVRYQVLHSLCDGSPSRIEELVVEAVKSFWNDPNDKIKRAARRAYNSWSRGDGINIL